MDITSLHRARGVRGVAGRRPGFSRSAVAAQHGLSVGRQARPLGIGEGEQIDVQTARHVVVFEPPPGEPAGRPDGRSCTPCTLPHARAARAASRPRASARAARVENDSGDHKVEEGLLVALRGRGRTPCGVAARRMTVYGRRSRPTARPRSDVAAVKARDKIIQGATICDEPIFSDPSLSITPMAPILKTLGRAKLPRARHGRARRRPAACARGEEQHVEEHGRDLGLEGGPRAAPPLNPAAWGPLLISC